MAEILHCEYWEHERYIRSKYCEYWEYEQYRTPTKGSTSSIEPRNTWSKAVSAVQNLELLRAILAAYNPEILPVLSTPAAPTESNLLQLPLVGPSVNIFCK